MKTVDAQNNRILITVSSNLDKIIFDGKSSSMAEWKQSSLDTLSYSDGNVIYLRTAHQDNFVYVFIDALYSNFEKNSDRAMICFDTNNDKSLLADSNDYCFMAILDNKRSFSYQGGSPFGLNGHFKNIPNSVDFIGIGSISDQNDRYSETPHPSYEFRIPTEVIGRSDIYGFYVYVYDSHYNKVYSWPQDIISDSPLQVPSPSVWGELVSPDKSLPEFELPMFAILTAFAFSVYLTKFRYR